MVCFPELFEPHWFLLPIPSQFHPKAEIMVKAVEIMPALIDSAFEILMRGKRNWHVEMVAGTARRLGKEVDTLLDQASMMRQA